MSEASRRLAEPVFVIGCCNSGTTILWKALLSHPGFCGPTCEGQDIEDLPRCLRHFLGKETFRLFAHTRFGNAYRLTERDYTPVVADALDAVYARYSKPGRRFLEKSPANAVRTRFLEAVYPDATFVVIIRNGLAVAEGIRRKRLFDPQRPHMAGLETTIEDAAIQWTNANSTLLEDRLHLKRSILVRYEDLVLNPAEVLGAVLNYCGVTPIEGNTPRFESDLNEKQIDRLSLQDRAAVLSIAGALLKELAYISEM